MYICGIILLLWISYQPPNYMYFYCLLHIFKSFFLYILSKHYDLDSPFYIMCYQYSVTVARIDTICYIQLCLFTYRRLKSKQ